MTTAYSPSSETLGIITRLAASDSTQSILMSSSLKIIALDNQAFQSIENCVRTNNFKMLDQLVERFRLDSNIQFSQRNDELLIHSPHEMFLFLNDEPASKSVKVIEGNCYVEDNFDFRYLRSTDAQEAIDFYVGQNFLNPETFVLRYRNKVVKYEEQMCNLIDEFGYSNSSELLAKTKKVYEEFNRKSKQHFDFTGKYLLESIDESRFIRINSCYNMLKIIEEYYTDILQRGNCWFFIN